MKIMIITSGYFPAKNYGGPPVSVRNICNLMKGNNQFFILCSNNELHSKEKLINKCDMWHKKKEASIKYIDFSEESISLAISEANPDVIYLQSFFSAKFVIPTLKIAKKKKIPLVLATRGELLPGAMKKKWKKIPYIKIMNTFYLNGVYIQATSQEEIEVNSKLLHNSSHILLENIPSYNISSTNKPKYKEKGKLKLIYFSRIVRKKNLKLTLEILSRTKGLIEFDVFGPIEDKSYWEECQQIIFMMPSNIKVSYCGILSVNEIGNVLNNYDFFIFLTKSENYGHVIAESILANCPVIISNQTPWSNINEYGNGYVFSLDEHDNVINRINKLIEMDNCTYQNLLIKNVAYIKNEIENDDLLKKYESFFMNLDK